jgi:ABC-type multidrug transport system fused ATPase/permease subunit
LPFVNALGGITLIEDQVVGDIELVDVTFRYPTKEDVDVLRGVSLKIEQN